MNINQNAGIIGIKFCLLLYGGIDIKLISFKKNRIRFDEECKLGEDTRFNVEYLSHSQTIKVADNTEYVYCARPDSALRKYWSERLEEEKAECILKEKLLGETEDFEWIKFIHWNVALEHSSLFLHNKEEKTCQKKIERNDQ